MTLLSIVIMSGGLLLFALCIPLMYRKVPMNGLYGVRFSTSFQSDEGERRKWEGTRRGSITIRAAGD